MISKLFGTLALKSEHIFTLLKADLTDVNTPADACEQQLTCLVSLLKICDIMGATILFFVLKYEVLIGLPDTHELLLCSIWLL